MHIREATQDDHDGIWEIFHHVIQTGDTYVFDPSTTRADFPRYWFAPGMKTFVAEDNGKIIGTYFIKPNQIGLGSHVCNCGYMVHPDARGKGTGSLMCTHSLTTAKAIGYNAMQFNIVVSTNDTAVSLWKKFGFAIIGTIPKGFNHARLGYVDAYIMHREV